MRFFRGEHLWARMSLAPPRQGAEVARRLAELLAGASGETPRLAPLDAAPAPARVVAVDGSHVVLAESGRQILAAFRAGSVGLEKGHATPPRVPPAEVALLAPRSARDAVAARLEADGFPAHGVPDLDPIGALDALRSLEEARVAEVALEGMDEGDLLLLDGALQARPHLPLLDRVLARAAERRVDVVGVCKSTSLMIGQAPALVACTLAARSLGAKAWWAPLPTPASVRGASFAARLSGAEERAFRFDVASADPRVLSRVAALCGHPAYPGYPSPLAMAHNAVLLNDDARRRLLAHVREAALAAGADPRAWDAAFLDYHDILELGA